MKNIISQRAGLMALLALVVLVASGCFVLGEYEDDEEEWPYADPEDDDDDEDEDDQDDDDDDVDEGESNDLDNVSDEYDWSALLEAFGLTSRTPAVDPNVRIK